MADAPIVWGLDAREADASLFASVARVCGVCAAASSKYKCPRCAAAYCSLSCYRQHSETCTESFYAEQAREALRADKAVTEEKIDMMRKLKRLEAEQKSGVHLPGASSSDEACSTPRAPRPAS